MTAALHDTADVDVGVIYTHEDAYLEALLASMERSAEHRRVRLILVDNASASGLDRWHGRGPRQTVLRNDRRLNYAANLNRIVAASTARYVLAMNTDMEFPAGEATLSRLVDFLDARPDCGVAGCRLYHPDGRYAHPARRFPGLPAILGRRLPLGRAFRRHVDAHLYKERREDETFECEWLSGCFLMLRREAVLAAGGFDPHYGKYFEDVDLCLRIGLAGWRVMHYGGASCIHHEQRASVRLASPDSRRHLAAYGRWLWKWGLSPRKLLARRIDPAHRHPVGPHHAPAAPHRVVPPPHSRGKSKVTRRPGS